MLPHLPIDLHLAPDKRWAGLSDYRTEAQKLCDSYTRDLGGMELLTSFLDEYVAAHVPAAYREEIASIAAIIDRPIAQVYAANLYYDAMRTLIGCTAFAIDTADGPLHARNLDWWTESNALNKYTCIVDAETAVGPYQAVSWPGFMGVFSGVAKGRFALTLNAVVSNEPQALAEPVTLLLRRVFDTAPDYQAALTLLAQSPIAADCLLLLTGTDPGEMVVIERTCTRHAIRRPANGLVTVTNDYRDLDDGFPSQQGVPQNALGMTSCARFNRAQYRALSEAPRTLEDCLAILQDPKVKMDITVQHMVMRARSGELRVVLP